LYATFRVLRETNHPAGRKFSEQEEELRKLLSARNDSILAHGIQSTKKETFEKFVQVIEGLLPPGHMVDFPVLEW
jgi:hypothetical protein